DDVLREAERSAAVTHDHPEGVKGARAVALAVFLARSDGTKGEIRDELQRRFGYDLSRRLDEIRPSYSFDVTAAGSVPEAIIAFLESESWESAVRNAISLGGDADTMACIAGGIAEGFHGLPPEIAATASDYLDESQRTVVAEFRKRFVDGRGRLLRSGPSPVR
ncbi:MAG TPA: ADP-ribosylglycohydrolase family protein, partial [Thermoanaerobaculia bacterium]|nr:ADP-ribosylglycohydrolase family protein [Thermoanaerobaculia bacterium]